MNTWWAIYLGSGVFVFVVLRIIARMAHVRVKTHDKIWTFWIWDLEGWIFGVLLWPLLAIAAIVWLVAEVCHRRAMRPVTQEEAKKRQEIRENPYRALPLDQLLSAVEAARKAEREEK